MTVGTTLLSILCVSLLIGVIAAGAHLFVLLSLRRRQVPMQFYLTGMPTYLLKLCRELPPSRERDRLVGLARWSAIALIVAIIGAGVSGPMLGSLNGNETSNNRFERSRGRAPLGRGGKSMMGIKQLRFTSAPPRVAQPHR
jgi:hypothetical protein